MSMWVLVIAPAKNVNFQQSISCLLSSYVCSFITSSALNFQGEKVLSVCTPQTRLLLVQLIYDLAPSVKPHGPAIHHDCDNGEQTSVSRSWLAPGRHNSLIWW